MFKRRKRILVAPLNWGLGHATRCIPVINSLLEQGFEPVIASDGESLMLLREEFPELHFESLPSYGVRYAKAPRRFKLKMLLSVPKWVVVICKEHIETRKLIKKLNLEGIVSDNRLGVWNRKIPSVYITHQINVLSGNSSWMSSKTHQLAIRNFDTCWIPDSRGGNSLSGEMSYTNDETLNPIYIGSLSRLEKKNLPLRYNLMVLLSGPEPQRSILERILLSELEQYDGSVVFVRGVMDEKTVKNTSQNMKIFNYLTYKYLEKLINQSEVVLSRSGYTTIMDLSKLEKKVFFIPTPGQYEQEYLAKRLQTLGLVPMCEQSKFNLSQLDRVASFSGLKSEFKQPEFDKLFRLFEGK